MKTVKFNKDFSKLNQNKFGTLRKAPEGQNIPYAENNVYKIESPSMKFKAKCTGIHVVRLEDVSTTFLVYDTDTNSREDALTILKEFYPDLSEKDIFLGIFFERED